MFCGFAPRATMSSTTCEQQQQQQQGQQQHQRQHPSGGRAQGSRRRPPPTDTTGGGGLCHRRPALAQHKLHQKRCGIWRPGHPKGATKGAPRCARSRTLRSLARMRPAPGAKPHLEHGPPRGQHGVGDQDQVVLSKLLGQLVQVGPAGGRGRARLSASGAERFGALRSLSSTASVTCPAPSAQMLLACCPPALCVHTLRMRVPAGTQPSL